MEEFTDPEDRPMTEDEAVQKLKKAEATGDNEAMHGVADDVLVNFIRANGFTKLADQFESMSRYFWYA